MPSFDKCIGAWVTFENPTGNYCDKLCCASEPLRDTLVHALFAVTLSLALDKAVTPLLPSPSLWYWDCDMTCADLFFSVVF